MPAGGALFGSAATRNASKNLVEFRAGKMTMKGNMVRPDKRKGLVYIYQSDDSLMHFCWKDRQSGSLEDDLIIFPDDCEFKRVTQCTTGRVYHLKFKSTTKKFFFWLQEPKTDKDDEYCRRVNEVLNNPPTPGMSRGGASNPEDLQNMLTNMSQQQLMQLFGGVRQVGGLSSLLGTMSSPLFSPSSSVSPRATSGTSSTSSSTATPSTPKPSTAKSSSKPATTTASAPAAAATGGSSSYTPSAIQLQDLQSLLSDIQAHKGPKSSGETANRPNVDLSSALNAEGLQAVLSNPGIVQNLQQHLPSLSSTTTSNSQQDQLRNTLASPQFQQAVSMFSTALQSGQLGPVVEQFSVGQDAVSAANEGNMEEFVKALEKATISSDDDSTPEQPDKKKKKESKSDEDMPMD
ncbi:proteasomal ubiquitin receptor ADRM1 homolog isoform X2 [Bemisia tabaci]|uniref:proteasomal ubiquitin receptor ADRM1 homolog isoform X2 n=1 Tax=Bemisia tabaci TaxID=7038 RepID=UPI003B280E04